MSDDIICSCNGITKEEVVAAIKEKNLQTVDEITEETMAGDGCGSCLDDLEDLLEETNS